MQNESERCGRKLSGLRVIYGILPEVVCKERRQSLDTSVRIVGVSSEIRTESIPNTEQNRLRFYLFSVRTPSPGVITFYIYI
jgi:hypothetical protein